MMGFIKLMVIVLLSAALFGAGYFAGSSREEKSNRLLESVKSEMKATVAGLEGEIRLLRFRMQLTAARDRLIAAMNRLSERNFGTAGKELASAKEELRAAAQRTPKENRESLTGIEKSLDDAIEAVRRSDPRAQSKLDAVKTDLDRLIRRF